MPGTLAPPGRRHRDSRAGRREVGESGEAYDTAGFGSTRKKR